MRRRRSTTPWWRSRAGTSPWTRRSARLREPRSIARQSRLPTARFATTSRRSRFWWLTSTRTTPRRSRPRTWTGARPTAARALVSAWLPPGPGVWRLTPPFAAPQVPWVGDVRRFVLQSVDQFLPDPPPSLQSDEWVEAFNEIKAYGSATSSVRSDEQTAVARFWSANVIRQYNRVGRDIADARGLGLPETARLAAMVNVVGADMGMSVLHAKYHYLFWRPVTAIDPSAVIADGFGPVPGYDDGNPATVEQTGWRP